MVNRGADDGFKGDDGKGRIGNGDQLASLRNADPAGVGWDQPSAYRLTIYRYANIVSFSKYR